MARLLVVSLLLVYVLVRTVYAHPICMDSSFPFVRGQDYAKCAEWNGLKTCVGPSNEADQVKEPQFNPAKSPSDICVQKLKKISCAVVDQWSGHLFRAEGSLSPRQVPYLCLEYCHTLYDQCAANVSMSHSSFVDNSNAYRTIASLYATRDAFCNKFASTDYCFQGEPFTVPPPQPEPFTPDPLCIERVVPEGGEPKVTFQPIPGHATRMIIGDLKGVVRVYVVDNNVTGKAFRLNGTMINIASKVAYAGERGLLGVALHKNFSTNGRLYVSFSCVGTGAGIDCTEGDSVIDEYRVVNPSNGNALQADMSTRRRIFRLVQPFANHNGGQILFSPDPRDPHLYFMLGDGGSGGDPGNRAQPLTTYFGKILRIDVDSTFATGGPGGVPKDNPFVNVAGALGMIWVNGLRNPWRCSFDRQTFLLYCGDVGQNTMEEIDIIIKGANYGWRKFEGTRLFNSATILRGSTTHTPPILSYFHSEASDFGYASVTGGYVARSSRDARMTGKYIFADIAGPVFLAREDPPNSGQWKRGRVGLQCTPSSPQSCSPARGSILSFGEMLSGDILFGDDLGSVYRFVEANRCPVPLTNSPTTYRPTMSPVPTVSNPTLSPSVKKPCTQLNRRRCRQRSDCRLTFTRKCRGRG